MSGNHVALEGSGLDSLVLSLELSRHEVPHTWQTSADRIGGHFRGWSNSCGQVSDLGMVLLEPDFRGAIQARLKDLQGQSGPDTRPFLPHVFSWLNDQDVRLEKVPIRAFIGESTFPDPFISDQLQFLDALASADQTAIKRELRSLIPRLGQAHPEHKRSSQSFNDDDLLSTLRTVNGPTLTKRIFEPWISSLDPTGVVRGIDHRRIWIPLYHPETVLGAFQGEYLPEVTFQAPQGNCVAVEVRRLAQMALASPWVDILTSDNDLDGSHLIDLSSVKAPGLVNTVELQFVHFCVEPADPVTTFVAAPVDGLFRWNIRRTSINGALGAALVEYVAKQAPPVHSILRHCRSMLEKAGYDCACGGDVKAIKMPLNSLPTTTKKVSSELDLVVSTAQSFNDQVLRGLRIAEEVASR